MSLPQQTQLLLVDKETEFYRIDNINLSFIVLKLHIYSILYNVVQILEFDISLCPV